MTTLSELVEDAKLAVRFFPDYVSHDVFDPAARGTREEDWRRDQFLGRGRFGTVWLERCLDDSDKVRAVKRVPRQSRSSHATDFTRELEAMIKFSQRKYARQFENLLGWYEDICSTYITMEYFPLGDLQSHLAVPLSEQEVQMIVYQVLQGLEQLHNNAFAHRDLKPENIFVVHTGPEWWIKIGDLGISKRVNQDTALRTRVGSPGYLAPEIVDQELYGTDTTPAEYTHAQLHELSAYVRGGEFPTSTLSEQGIGPEGQDFIRSLMTPAPKSRVIVQVALQDAWIKYHSQSSNSMPEQPTSRKRRLNDNGTDVGIYDPVGAEGPERSQEMAYTGLHSGLDCDVSRSWFGTNEWTTREATTRTLRDTTPLDGAIQTPHEPLAKPLTRANSMRVQPPQATRNKSTPSPSVQEPSEDNTLSIAGEAQHLAGLKLWRAQKPNKAEASFTKAFRERRRTLGLDHEHTLFSLHMITQCLLRQKKFTYAQQLLQRHCAKEQRTFGRLCELMITVCDNLASQLFPLRDYESATKMAFVLYAALDQKDTEQTKEEQLSCWNYAMCLYTQGRYSEAKVYCQSIRKQSARRHKPFYFKVRFLMALCEFQNGHFKDAEGMFRDLHHDQCHILGRCHDDTLITFHMLGCTYHEQQFYNTAHASFREIHITRVDVFGDRNADTTFSARCHRLSSKARHSSLEQRILRKGPPPPIPIHEPTLAWWEQLPGPQIDEPVRQAPYEEIIEMRSSHCASVLSMGDLRWLYNQCSQAGFFLTRERRDKPNLT
ncbi:kinase-like domain-containing protein [Aspergillus carlsbadensis]|nr:kinase-like domain-containing protein [Aspergillus carlsbadensis]